MHTAWLFPGQGSQKIGMGQDVIELNDAKRRFDLASNIFNKDLYQICGLQIDNNNDEENLNDTKNTQICLFLVESILLDSLKAKGYKPDYLAGHSLGEITALYAAEVLSFEDCVSLIKIRSELMSSAVKGSMAALIGFNIDELRKSVDAQDDVVIANDNSSSQVVLSGNREKLESLSKIISCKRFIFLNVSGAFHSHFMKDPSQKFSKYLDGVNFKEPILPVISNSNPTLCSDSNELKIRLKDQMCNGVRWRETMDLIKFQGDDIHIVEIGPSNVLGGLAKRHLKNIKISQVSSSEQISY
tara:strand:+ start:242 stop:1141 length:900 start_codon:yes stop_codon:yes gene_type:complete